jgi:hypothetical protein
MLDYESHLPRYQPTPGDRTWFWRRMAYYVLHLLLLGLIVYRVGPNLFLFHSPFSPTPIEFAQIARKYAPMVAAIKAYQRDYPNAVLDITDELPPPYMPPNGNQLYGSIAARPSVTFPTGSAVLEYDFTPAIEGWVVHSPRYNGRISAPTVPAARIAATHPATTSITTPSSNTRNAHAH